MRLLLDSDTLSALLGNEAQVRDHFESAAASPETLFLLSPMVDLELRRYLLLKEANRLLQQYEALVAGWSRPDLTEDDLRLAATLRAQRQTAGHPIEDADLLLAVSAIRNHAILVTSNPGTFADLGLELVDWRQPIPV